MREVLNLNVNWLYKNSFSEEDVLSKDFSNYEKIK